MSKVGSSSSPSARVQGRRSYWVRSTVSASPGSEGSAASPRKTGNKRFLEPHRLSTEQRAAILSRLQEGQIGDEESRRLFTAALEYDLAGCNRLAAAPPEPASADGEATRPEQDASLQALARAAGALADELAGLDASAASRLRQALAAADRFARGYGESYIESMCTELRRIAQIGDAPACPAPPQAARPALDEDARRFVLRAADAFENCFEITPIAQPGSPFPATLEAIVAATGIAVPTDQGALARILDRD